MIANLFLALSLSTPGAAEIPSCTLPTPMPVADASYRELWESGETFASFYARAERRRELWERNYAHGEAIAPAMLERARAIPGTWRFLVVAVDGCSDSVSTIPFLARLVEAVEGLDLRIVDPEAGRAIMEAHRTPDGRAATPTVLLLDDAWEEAGCFIERPAPLQDWIMAEQDGMTRSEVFDYKMNWYEEDRGVSTVEQFVSLLEAAAGGDPRCDAREGP